jgi:hypothetical protein
MAIASDQMEHAALLRRCYHRAPSSSPISICVYIYIDAAACMNKYRVPVTVISRSQQLAPYTTICSIFDPPINQLEHSTRSTLHISSCIYAFIYKYVYVCMHAYVFFC